MLLNFSMESKTFTEKDKSYRIASIVNVGLNVIALNKTYVKIKKSVLQLIL